MIVQSDEDDCSAASAERFDGDETGALGPLESFRCTRHGVTCDQSLEEVGAKTACVPAVGDPYLTDVATLAAPVAVAQPDPQRRATATITAPPAPFAVERRADAEHLTPVLALAASCSFADAAGKEAVAAPAVRIDAWRQALGGAAYSVCQIDDTPMLHAIAGQLVAVVDGDP